MASFKPHPSVYAYALASLGEPPATVAMVATHPWDLAGAAAAGMRTVWLRHGVRSWPAVFREPDTQAGTLSDLPAAIHALPASPGGRAAA